MALSEPLIRIPGWSAQEPMKPFARHAEARAEIEVIEVQPEGTVRLEVHHAVENHAGVLWLPIRREPDDLVLAGIDLEARVIRERGIEKAERVGKVNLSVHLQAVPRADADRGRRPLADTIHREDDRLFER